MQINPYAGFWLPGEFIFLYQQVEWYIECYEVMARGDWPIDPFRVRSETLSPHGYFETPIAVWLDFLPRFQATGRDGEMAVDFYCYQKDEGRLAQIYNCRYDQVGKRIRRVVRYISGKDRKDISYREFCQHRRPGFPHSKATHRNFTKHSKENKVTKIATRLP